MTLSSVAPDAFFQFTETLWWWHLCAEEFTVDILGAEASCTTNDHLVPFLFPLEDGTGTDAEFPAYVPRD
jgi:hypothetical protein